MLDLPRPLLIVWLAVLGGLVSAAAASAAPGDLDPTFGSGGVVELLHSNEKSNAKGIAVQPDDKVVVAGYEEPGNAVLVRLLENGQPDPGFGVGGKVVTPLPGGRSEFRAVAVQADGKIVAAGAAQGAADGDFLLARYNPDGSSDPGFGGGDGVAIVPVGAKYDLAEGVAIGADGRIAAVGLSEVAEGKYIGGVAVLLGNGTPDATFDGDGLKTFETPPGNDQPAAVEMLADGRILIGDSSGAGRGEGFSLVQLLPTGGFDPGFGGGDGIALAPIPGEGLTPGYGRITDLALLPDGRIATAGEGTDYVGTPPDFYSKAAAVMYLSDGEPDVGFAFSGIFSRQLGKESHASTIDPAEGGKLLLAGGYRDPASGKRAPAAIRLDPDGDPDPSFGSGGLVLRGQTAPIDESVADAAVDSRDRLVTVGDVNGPGGATWVTVTRYLGDRGPRPSAAGDPANRPPHARMAKVPRKVSAVALKGFRGTASDPDGDALRRVQLALVKLVRGGAKASRRAAPRCFVLNRRGRFKRIRVRKGKRCPQRWLTAKGKARWAFRLKRRLPPGRYVVYARAVDARGLTESAFSRRAGNRFAFRIRPRR